MRYHGSVKYHAVGQGLFVSGSISRDYDSVDRVSWVFDCGTASKNHYLERELKVFNSTSNGKIDIVFISHFHVDHIRGLPSLLSGRGCEYLILPYLTPAERLVLLALSGDEGSESLPDYRDTFYFDPTGYLDKLLGDYKPSKYLFVDQPSETRSSAPIEEGNNGPSEQKREVIKVELDPGMEVVDRKSEENETEADEIAGDLDPITESRDFIARGRTRILVNGVWEWMIYNDKRVSRLDSVMLQGVMAEVGTLMSGAGENECKVAIRSIRRKYEDEYGTSTRNANAISLHVLTRPIGMINDRRRLACDLWWCGHAKRKLRCTSIEGDSGGHLLTGDAYIDNAEAWTALSDAFDGATERIVTMQIMHHGSRKNYFKGIAQYAKPEIAVYCADNNDDRYQHPSAELLKEYQCTIQIVVNTVDSLDVEHYIG